jgi:hypothetical protein
MRYIVTFIFIFISYMAYAQGIQGTGIEVVEFNAPFSPTKCEFLDDLDDCEILRIDISTDVAAQKEHKIVVVPTLVIFSDGVEVSRFQANIMMQLEITQDEVQDAISEAIMSGF